jgi:hypothetical protein
VNRRDHALKRRSFSIAEMKAIAACVLAATSIDSYMVQTLNLLLGAMRVRLNSAAGFISICGLVTACLTAPQVAIALVAGWISQRWWKPRHSETVSIDG